MAWNFQVRKVICPTRLFDMDFNGSIFTEVAEICYTKLNLLLLAMEARKYEGGDIYINPKNKVINPNAIGESVFNLLRNRFTRL